MKRTLVACAAMVMAASALAQPTAFTYQGRLVDGGVPANGLHDFRFRLFDAASGGTQVGAVQCVDNLQVQDGAFAATVDFGAAFTTPATRFIEVEVRRDTGLTCSTTTGFTLLTTRQAIRATPLATHAKSAFALDSANGSIANAVFVDNSGKVGVGTLTPTHTIHIASAEPTLALQDTDSSGGASGQQVGYVSYRDSANSERGWIGYGSPGDPDLSIVNARPGGDIVLRAFGTSRVGIGTTTPGAALDVRGDVRLGNSGQLFATAGEGNLRIIRGTVDHNGAIVAGEGFTITYLQAGTYRVNFTTPFAGTPTFVATTDEEVDIMSNVDFFVAGVYAVGASSAQVRTRATSVNLGFYGTRVNEMFHFIAIGPR